MIGELPRADEEAERRRGQPSAQSSPQSMAIREAPRSHIARCPGAERSRSGYLRARRGERHVAGWLADAGQHVPLCALGRRERVGAARRLADLAREQPQATGAAGAGAAAEVGAVAVALQTFEQRLARLHVERRTAVGQAQPRNGVS